MSASPAKPPHRPATVGLGSGKPSLPPRTKPTIRSKPETPSNLAPKTSTDVAATPPSVPETPPVHHYNEQQPALATVPETSAEAPEASEDAKTIKDLQAAAQKAVERTQVAVDVGDADDVIDAAQALDDAVDDQLKESKEEAVEAVVALMSAAVSAEEAVEEATKILDSKKEEAPVVAVAEEEAEEEATEILNSKKEEASVIAVAETAAVKSDEGPVAAAVETAKTEEKKEEKKEATTTATKESEKASKKPSQPPKPTQSEQATTAEADATDDPDSFASAIAPPPDEADDQVESIQDIPHPILSFAEAPSPEEPLTPLESKARDLSVHAHKLIKENNKLVQAVKEQQEALDLVLGEEGRGKVRPSLVAACAFSLADMLIAQRKISETKVALATAHEAAHSLDGKGAVIRALMNYAYVLRNDSKPRSTRNTYEAALKIATEEFGAVHPTVEQVKYEYTGYLAKTGRDEEATEKLLAGADALVAESERLESQEGEKDGDEKKEEKKEDKKKEFVDPGSGLEHIQAEQSQSGDADKDAEEKLPLFKQAKHYAMRNLMNAAGLLDAANASDKAHDALAKAMQLAIDVHGENSVHHMNSIYALGVHYKRLGQIEEAINAHETVLNIMDETIEVYEPDVLQNRIAILRDTAVLYDQAGEPETALDYAQGALVNAQTLAKILAPAPAARHIRTQMLEPFWLLLADIKGKTGDADGAAEARREALKGKLASRNGGASGGGSGGSRGGTLKRNQNSKGQATARAGGRRV